MSTPHDPKHQTGDSLEELLGEIARTPPPPPSPDLADRVMERVRRDAVSPPQRRTRWMVTAAAAAVLAAVAGLPILFPRDQGELPPEFLPDPFDVAGPAMRLSLLEVLPETREALVRDGQGLFAYAKTLQNTSLFLIADQGEEDHTAD